MKNLLNFNECIINKRILFLDIDGVLQPDGIAHIIEYAFNEMACLELSSICDALEIKIVLCSDRVKDENIFQKLDEFGLDKDLILGTCDPFTFPDNHSNSKSTRINNFLKEIRKLGHTKNNFVILEDCLSLDKELESHRIKPKKAQISYEDCRAVIDKFFELEEI